jgi:hypothetical protein
VVTPYLAKYGKPSEDTGSAYLWDDERTHLEIALSGDIMYFSQIERSRPRLAKRSEANTDDVPASANGFD